MKNAIFFTILKNIKLPLIISFYFFFAFVVKISKQNNKMCPSFLFDWKMSINLWKRMKSTQNIVKKSKNRLVIFQTIVMMIFKSRFFCTWLFVYLWAIAELFKNSRISILWSVEMHLRTLEGKTNFIFYIPFFMLKLLISSF